MKLWSSILGWLGLAPTVESPAVPATKACAAVDPVTDEPIEDIAEPVDDTPVNQDQPAEPIQNVWWQRSENTVTEMPVQTLPDNVKVQALAKELQAFIENPDIDLPHLPHVAHRVLTALRQPNINWPGVAQVLSQDQTLSASTLRLANSAAFATDTEVTNLEVALSRLGMKSLRNLMIKESVKAITVIKTADGASTAEQLWRKSVACSVIMEQLAALYEIPSDEAFLLGLLHDIGEVVLLRLVHDYERVSKQKVPQELFDYICQEHHQQVGHVLSENWNLPTSIRPVIKHHHGAIDADDRYARSKCVVQISDVLASLMGFGQECPYDALNTPAALQLRFGTQSEHLDVLEYLPDLVRAEMTLAF